MGFEIKGLDNLQKQLNKMSRQAEKLSKGQKVSFDVLFNASFMRRCSKFSSFSDFLEDGNYHVESQEDFEAIPDDEFDIHVRNKTKFKSWKDMFQTASNDYVKKELGL